VDDEMLFCSPIWGRFALGFRDFFFWEVVGWLPGWGAGGGGGRSEGEWSDMLWVWEVLSTTACRDAKIMITVCWVRRLNWPWTLESETWSQNITTCNWIYTMYIQSVNCDQTLSATS
jgi:hypothetical protein